MTLLVVADGMGGASAGEVASRLAVETITQTISQAQEHEWDAPESLLLKAIDAANQRICQIAEDTVAYEGMGTTVVTALMDDHRVFLAHAGDSRAYLYHHTEVKQATLDHSLVAELVRLGQLTEAEAQHHPQRHIVTRSLGNVEFGYADAQSLSWSPGDVLLLCTDGLSNLVDGVDLNEALCQAQSCESPASLELVADKLVNLALERGGHDNITLILAVHREAGDVE